MSCRSDCVSDASDNPKPIEFHGTCSQSGTCVHDSMCRVICVKNAVVSPRLKLVKLDVALAGAKDGALSFARRWWIVTLPRLLCNIPLLIVDFDIVVWFGNVGCGSTVSRLTNYTVYSVHFIPATQVLRWIEILHEAGPLTKSTYRQATDQIGDPDGRCQTKHDLDGTFLFCSYLTHFL